MPIYEYKCSVCGNIEEAFQKISDAPLTNCNKCEGQLNKIISHSSFHLKGAGWYVTDYGGSNSTNHKNSNDKNSGNNTESTCSSAKSCQSCSSPTNKAE